MAGPAVRRGTFEWRQVRVGVFLLVALALLAYGIIRVGELFDVFAKRYALVTLLPSASGVLEGSPVTLAGQRVGQVERIEFLKPGEDAGNHLSLTLSINQEVRDHIRANSLVRVRTQGLLGDRFIDIAPGTPPAPVLQPGDTIQSVPAVEFEELLVTAATTLEGARALIDDLRQITRTLIEGRGTLGRLLTDDALYQRMIATTEALGITLREINQADGTLARLIHDPALYDEIHGTIARIDSIGMAILSGEGTLGLLIQDDAAYQALLGAIGRADSTILSFGGALSGLTDGEGTIQRFLTDPALYDEFLRAVIELQTLIQDMRENPRKYRPEVKVDVF